MRTANVLGTSLVLALGACLLVPAPAAADVDLAVATIYSGYSGGSWEISVHLDVRYHGSHGPVTSDINVYFDGVWAYSQPFSMEMYPVVTCEDSAPACDGICQPLLINGQLTNGTCANWSYGGGCCCLYVFFSDPHLEADTGQMTCTAVVDEGDTVTEPDEANNVMTISLVPVRERPRTWSAVKLIYR